PEPRPPPPTRARAPRPPTTSRSTRTPSPRTGSTTTCTTSTPEGGRRPTTSASWATTTRSSGTGATTSTCGSPAGRAGTLAPGGRRDPGGPPVPERGRQAPVHGPVGRGDRERHRRDAVLRSGGQPAVRGRLAGGDRAVPELAGQERLPPVLPRGLPLRLRRRPRRRRESVPDRRIGRAGRRAAPARWDA